MKENKKELLHRREFFKKAAKKSLPIVAAIVAPSLFVSCGDDGEDVTGCSDCSGTCASDCSSSCVGQSYTSTCSSCANNCTGSCDTSCSETCKNNSTNNSDADEDEGGISKATGTIGGYEYVDLGLSVKWATQNIGAKSPEKAGSYYLFSTQEGNGGTSAALYFLEAGYRAGDSIAGSNYDIATKRMGNLWKTPTIEQIEELLSNCKDEGYELNGVAGVKLTSRKNGKSIFIPAAGKKDVYTLKYQTQIFIWSSTFQSIKAAGGGGYVLRGSRRTGGGYSFSTLGSESVDSQRLPIRAVTDGTSSTGCNGGCNSNCANNSTSGSSCSNCASTCSSGCRRQCDYNCAATCDSHCYGTCNDSCGGSCRYVSAGANCSGCASTCYNRCYHDCSYACSTSCQSSCVNSSK